MIATENEFVTVPEVTLPGGIVVPSFQVGQYLCSKDDNGNPVVNATGKPWVNINYHDARSACAQAGYTLLTETQALAIAWNISQQDQNWSGGKVGEGHIFQGLHKGNVGEAQAGTYESDDPDERRWHVLSNGERLHDHSGLSLIHI